MRLLLPLLLATLFSTCVCAQNVTGPKLLGSASFSSMNYGDTYPNSRSYGVSFEHESPTGPSLGIGFEVDLANGKTTGAIPILTAQIQYSRITNFTSSEEVGGLSFERRFRLSALSALIQTGARIPIDGTISAEVGAAFNAFLGFNEKRESTRITDDRITEISINFAEGGKVAIGPFVGLYLESGRYGYGLRGQYLISPVSKRAGYYPRSFSMLRIAFMVSYRLKG